jgi:(5-formylfuran-3-yl)methyl phosphate synthase
MRLLVSVRSAAEVAPALAGGADIVDAKEPVLGSLGAVSEPVLREIAWSLQDGAPLSIALGDPASGAAVAPALAALDDLRPRPSRAYVKIGLAGAADPAALLAAAVSAAARTTLRPGVIAVAYADSLHAGVPAPEAVVSLAAAAGAEGVLLDTWGKDGRDLLSHLPEPALLTWIQDAKARSLVVALAGSLSVEGVRIVSGLPADVVGVRSAACVGGRTGSVVAARVAELKAAIAEGIAATGAAAPSS